MSFNSHVEQLVTVTVALVNRLTPGLAGGREVTVPDDDALPTAIQDAVATQGYDGRTTRSQARALVPWVSRARAVITALDRGDEGTAAARVNEMLRDSGARPQLDLDHEGQHRLHFHGPDDSFVRGWSAGMAAGLAMAIGGDLGHRLGLCEAPGCDRVWVDLSRNAHRRFCSARCQSRVKAAAHRQRRRGGPTGGAGRA